MFASNTSQVSSDATYIEDVFSTWLYTGNGSTQTINNGIDLAGEGALTWIKQRSTAGGHQLYDTARGATQLLSSSNANAQSTFAAGLTSFNADGFSLGNGINCNTSGETYASWTFRKQPKFFDVVTYTGTGVAVRQIAHGLTSTPGFIIVKRTDSTGNWAVLSQTGATTYTTLQLNTTNSSQAAGVYFGNGTTTFAAPTSTTFTVSANADVNANGATYVAYLFAHNAGGFGLSGTDNVISCGSYTGGTIGQSINLGYEPQWLLTKNATSANDWRIWDNMRGVTTGDTPDAWLIPNLSNAEATGNEYVAFNANGFTLESANGSINGASNTYIYIAIRRGPMKTPTSGASVFSPTTYNGNVINNRLINTGLLTDVVFVRNTSNVLTGSFRVASRLTGNEYLQTSATSSGVTNANAFMTPTSGYGNSFSAMNGFGVGSDSTAFLNNSSGNIAEALRRAPGFFDVVCYTGTGAARTVAHNLGVVPELMIVKNRSIARSWAVYDASNGATRVTFLNTTAGYATSSNPWNNTAPTSSVFTVGIGNETNFSGDNFVAYLFATCAGVSKVGSYTGTGTTLQVDCGFTAGARFVLIKRTDSTGDWYVWDSARGIVAGNDPYLLLNSTAAEVTNTDYIDTAATGFEISSTAPAAINANGGSFIFFAVA